MLGCFNFMVIVYFWINMLMFILGILYCDKNRASFVVVVVIAVTVVIVAV